MSKRKKRSFYLFIFLITLSIYIIGCQFKKNKSMDTWVGEYKFSECDSQIDAVTMIMDYNISIYEEKQKYYADIVVIGQTTNTAIKAEVEGDEKEISLVFQSYLPEHVIGVNAEQGDVLLRLRQENSDLYTYWEKLTPMLYKNEVSGNIYFTRE